MLCQINVVSHNIFYTSQNKKGNFKVSVCRGRAFIRGRADRRVALAHRPPGGTIGETGRDRRWGLGRAIWTCWAG